MDLCLMKVGAGPDIKGESTIQGHTGEIELTSFSHGISLPMQINPSTNGRTVGRVQHQEFTVTKQVDLATPKLNLYCCQGTNIATVTIVLARNDGNDVLPIVTYTLTNCIVSAVSVGGGVGGASETVTFNYTKINWLYQSQKKTDTQEGKDEATWNLETNKNA